MKKQDQEELHRVVELVKQGIESFREAGRVLVAKLDSGVDVYGFYAALPDMPFGIPFLRNLEKVGRGQLHPHLLLGAGQPWIRHARKLPYSEQVKLLEAKQVELVVEKPTGTDILKVAVEDLSEAQARQVFHNGLASAGAQKAYLEDQKRAEVTNVPWRILRGGKVEFRRGCILSAKELDAIRQQLKATAKA